ncbi:dihydrofolate reductase [Flavobacterium sp. CYK-55]|uniref:dihydrofolate reductase n=1 Tax=Flavobacterium sp. CYK-55 TaxID=2835529 RepID=UPI001BD139BB|nr:dihydrofolate reductase [Flavobacterium sp. CYK-55]MBS7785855.1 dihydrofolate reductase [Flavobacterium sp. CYK-55]
MIILIAAMAENRALGKNNQLLWHLPDDFKRFKQLTSGHFIVMGRKTFESLPGKLPNRTHIIISRQKDYEIEGCLTATSLENGLKLVPEGQDVFVIGGGQIYEQSLPIADVVELTRVHTEMDADTFFPEINFDYWQLTSKEYHQKDEKHAFDFTFETYLRKA